MTSRLLLAIVLAAGLLRADLDQAKAEPNLGKRAMLALDNAFNALTQARDAYAKGDNAQVAAFAKEIEESVQLAETSLQRDGQESAQKAQVVSSAPKVPRAICCAGWIRFSNPWTWRTVPCSMP